MTDPSIHFSSDTKKITASDGTNSFSITLNNDNTFAILTLNNELVYTFTVLQLNGEWVLQGIVPKSLPPIGIKHHYSRLSNCSICTHVYTVKKSLL